MVHLAGLMGKPVLLLDRYDGCWRWLHGRSDSPRYPHAILRQDNPGDWSGPHGARRCGPWTRGTRGGLSETVGRTGLTGGP